MTDYELHITHVNEYLQCKRAWKLSAPRPFGRSFRPNQPYPPFLLGSMIHYALEQWYRRGTPVDQGATQFLTNEGITGLDPELEALARGMLNHYVLWQQHDTSPFADSQFDFIAPEQEFRLELLRLKNGKPVYFAGRIDGLVQHKRTGKYYVWEIKTTRSISERVTLLDRELQTGAYLWAVEHNLGIRPDGMLYTLMRKALPKAPQVLKSGKLSTAKDIDTSYEQYRNDLYRHYGVLDTATIEPHLEVVNALRSKPNPFFMRVPIYRTAHELDQLVKQLRQIALEMIRPGTALYPHPGNHCKYCLFANPCELVNHGDIGAANRQLATNYKVVDRTKGGAHEEG